jgi:AraC-like DNA-binding protein
MMLLDQLLGELDVEVDTFAVCEVRKGACLVLQEDVAAAIHYVLAGKGIAQPMGGSPILLEPQTVVVAPPGSCLVISAGWGATMTMPTPDCRPLVGGWDWNIVGDGDSGVLLACGTVAALHRETVGLFDYLRTPLVENMTQDASFEQPFHRLLDELSAPKAGTKALTEILMKECLVSLLRRQCESGECRAPWLAALEHPHLSKALAAMMDRPSAPFTLEGLADIAGMSRATFAERFRLAFQRTPMEFLRDVRLRLAARLLTTTDLPVKTVAGRVGFASRSHFSRAFKAYAGSDPAAYRAAKSRPESVD